MPSQDGRTALVTGANSGIGYETARVLADAGARVIVAARNEAKGRTAALAVGNGAEWRPLDLASLASVAAFAKRLLSEEARIDLLILNAGIMAPPRRETTADGFELQLGVNYLGHFALTARLWPLLVATSGARVIALSSIAARRGRIRFGDLQFERRYDPWAAYAQTKLAMLIFARELARRAEGTGVASIAAHPGFARTRLIANGMGESPRGRLATIAARLFGQSAAEGALPVLRAATDPAVRSGDYVGSTGWLELKGPPGPADVPPAARDPETAKRLWTVSEELIGLAFRP